ncbi:hypothetical protein ABPG72_008141 [Tetrahymena utriculariae]
MNICMTIGGFAVDQTRGWQMALVTTSALPVITLGDLAFALAVKMSQKKKQVLLKRPEDLQDKDQMLLKQLNHQLVKNLSSKTTKLDQFKLLKYLVNMQYGLALVQDQYLLMFLDYALSFWYGSVLVGDSIYNSTYDRDYTQGDVFVIFFAIIIGGFSLGQCTPCIKKFQSGKLAAAKIFEVIDREPQIMLPSSPQIIQHLTGNIKFNNFSFSYPFKKDSSILKNLNLEIKANQKTAIVGESGCEKSAIIYVGQEPVLFATTVRENQNFGRNDATEQEMINTLKQANAWKFVSIFFDKLDTYVGNSGSQLSGGQNQRIFIDRAILNNPQILLLEEATSALDRKNEVSIQQTLDQISKGRTTIVIAHRLSTVENSDKILVIDQGQLIEQGTFEELIDQKGKFQSLAKNQIQRYASEEDERDLENQLNQELDQGFTNAQVQDQLKKSSIKYCLEKEVQDQQLDKQNSLSREQKRILKQEEKTMLNRLHDINKPDRIILYFGIFFALGNGVCFPLSGFLLGEYVDVLAHPGADNYNSELIGFLWVLCFQQLQFKCLALFSHSFLPQLVKF